jgi:hypothetical protein
MKSILVPIIMFCSVAVFAAEKAGLPSAYTDRNVEGWNVRIDNRLLAGESAPIGELALKVLNAKLVNITLLVPKEALSKLQSVTIEMDLDYGGLSSMQYHNDAGWLRDNGYSEKLAKCVHIPVADHLMSTYDNHRMPLVILHELAHAYHDQVLGFDEPRIKAAWKKFCDSGKYKSVLTSPGHMHEHYGLTNQMEFFAEMTESYFGSNDFYPFVAGELKRDEPEIYALMSEIWGPLAPREVKPATPKP